MKIGSNGLFPSYNVDAATLLQTMLTAISNFPTKPDIVALTSSIKAVDPGLDTAALLKTLSAASTATLSEQAFTNFVVSLGASTDAIAANGGISSLVMAMIADLSKTTATDAVSAVMQTLATYGVTLNSVADVASKLMAGLAALLGQK
ncbi:hypothetical protein DFJ73DRAFT_760455 [Zopfochytrium polystomum]|nr:hypothetical protein DFJ73DRAFT_760455 [Zopfochytrium polystomum]